MWAFAIELACSFGAHACGVFAVCLSGESGADLVQSWSKKSQRLSGSQTPQHSVSLGCCRGLVWSCPESGRQCGTQLSPRNSAEGNEKLLSADGVSATSISHPQSPPSLSSAIANPLAQRHQCTISISTSFGREQIIPSHFARTRAAGPLLATGNQLCLCVTDTARHTRRDVRSCARSRSPLCDVAGRGRGNICDDCGKVWPAGPATLALYVSRRGHPRFYRGCLRGMGSTEFVRSM